MLNLLRFTYYLASAVSLFAGLATTASLFMADRAPQSPQYWVVTLAVILFFGLAGLLLLCIGRQLVALGVLAGTATDDHGAILRARWNRLAACMVLGGLVLLPILLLVAYVIVARIEQGFAIFG
ncbi:MAG TPA: hypothetical protein PL152_03755 [Steroidobacteraceae bacterium]|nr:hypothetical protein [Steroidobacteraceae bacterium]